MDGFRYEFAPIRRALRRTAFTLIEVMVTLGVVMLLIGIWMPALSGAWTAAQNTKWSSVVRHGGAVIQMYQNDYQCFPLAYQSARQSTLHWNRLVVDLGYAPNGAMLDPALSEPERVPTVHLSMCVTVRASDLSPGIPPPPAGLRSSPVRDDMIAFPSDKGVLLRMWVDPTVTNPTSFCCPVPAWQVPVGMADGSVTLGSWQDFCLEETPSIVDGLYGIPVYSTWGGYLARDR